MISWIWSRKTRLPSQDVFTKMNQPVQWTSDPQAADAPISHGGRPTMFVFTWHIGGGLVEFNGHELVVLHQADASCRLQHRGVTRSVGALRAQKGYQADAADASRFVFREAGQSPGIRFWSSWTPTRLGKTLGELRNNLIELIPISLEVGSLSMFFYFLFSECYTVLHSLC